MYHPKTRWQLTQIDEEHVEALARDVGVHPTIARILALRGLRDKEQVFRFLHVSHDGLYDPFRLHGMQEAVTRIRRALEMDEKIWIYGDYDADGVSGTSAMIETFRLLGKEVSYYIPNRFTEGYGLNKAALEAAAAQGISLVITVDTGITAVEEAEWAQTRGLDLIITDHHEPPSVLPHAMAVINPKQPACDYPNDMLAGVGVTFKLAHALLGRVPDELLPLAALGTIADLVPLVDENRVIATLGLKKINERQHTGINALLDVAGLSDREVTAGHVGFALGPRINASGRLDTAKPAVQLLTSRSYDEALILAKQLDDINQERQKLVDEITEMAISEVTVNEDEHRYAIVLARPGWNVGVLGIVASRLVERFYRPAVVLGVDETSGQAKGSARSIEGFDLYRALSKFQELLPHFGGHKMAAGMTMAARDVETLRTRLNVLVSEWLTEDDFVPVAHIDVACSVEEIETEWVEQLSLLEPFGAGNKTPRFHITGGRLQEIRRIGREQSHLRLSLATGASKLQAVAFQMGEVAEEIAPGVHLEAVGELEINEWNGNRSPQLIVHDISVPHLQVFDWRGRTISDEMWQRLTEQKALFVCFEQGNVSRVRRFLQQYDISVLCLQNRDDVDKAIGDFRHLICIDFPTDDALYYGILQNMTKLERVTFLGEVEEAVYMIPKRSHFKRIYALLHRNKMVIDDHTLVERSRLPRETVSFILDVFTELGFIERSVSGIKLKANPRKRPLTESSLMQQRKKRIDVYQRFYYASARELADEITKIREGNLSRSGGDQHGFQRQDSHHRKLSSAGSSL